MPDMKPRYESKGVWGGIIAALAGIAGAFGYASTPDEQAVLAEALPAVLAAASSQWLAASPPPSSTAPRIRHR